MKQWVFLIIDQMANMSYENYAMFSAYTLKNKSFKKGDVCSDFLEEPFLVL